MQRIVIDRATSLDGERLNFKANDAHFVATLHMMHFHCVVQMIVEHESEARLVLADENALPIVHF